MTDSPGQFTVPTPPQAAPGGGYPPQVPQQFQPQQPQPRAPKGNGLAVAALVLGIIALVFCWIPFLNVLSIILGLIGLGLGVPGLLGALRGRRSGKGMAIAGVILSVVAVIAAIAISAAATLAVDDALSGSDVSTSTDGDSGSSAAAGTGDAAGDEAASDDGVYAFGDTVTFEDGSTLVVEAPIKFRPKGFAAGGEAFPAHVKYKATFTNNTDEVFDPGLTDGSVSSAGVEGDSVYQDGLDAPDNPVLPGKSVTWWMGYGVQDPADTQLTVRLGFLDYEDVIFTP
jgi:hypothetical protein